MPPIQAQVAAKNIVSVTDNVSFIDLLLAELKNGGGFTPFLGSGCSSPSGIMMGQQLDAYLAYAVFRCICPETATGHNNASVSNIRWNLRRDGWPEKPRVEQMAEAQLWIRYAFDKIAENSGLRPKEDSHGNIRDLTAIGTYAKPEDVAKRLVCPMLPRILRGDPCDVNQEALKSFFLYLAKDGLQRGGYSVPGMSPTSEDAIIDRAIRSLYDWRSTLTFLSEVQLLSDNTILLDSPDSSIIDRFNVYITRGRRCNLIHSMLCHLAAPARFRVILTTNFDTLIEDAFNELNHRLEVISVSSKGSLPDPAIVHARNTLVKMHGTLSETRADFSLDESPSLENKQAFFNYVRGCSPKSEAVCSYIPSQLLVCGYSGSDNRCVEMIKYVLDADREARVYWICYNAPDLDQLRKLFQETTYAARIFSTVTERADLLLYELYQRYLLNLPGGGFSYQYTHNVPPDTTRFEEGRNGIEEAAIKIVSKRAGWFSKPKPSDPRTRRKLLIADGSPGVLATLRRVTQKLIAEKRVSQIWLELEDYADTFCIAFEVFLIISIRLGLFQLGHADLIPYTFMRQCETKKSRKALVALWKKHLELLVDGYFGITPGDWVIVLYGRNGPGGCSGWRESSFWKADYMPTLPKSGGQQFSAFVQALGLIGFHVVFSPYTKGRYDRDYKKTAQLSEIIAKRLKLRPVSVAPMSLPTRAQVTSIVPSAFTLRFPSLRLTVGRSQITFGISLRKICAEWIDASAKRNAVKKVGRNIYLENIRFLYASTLFRQSRHYSAFLNEGVMRCPYRFNIDGIDNDWIRDRLLRENLKSLMEAGLFYEKPGGFAWAYRDFRLGVRWLIEALPLKYLHSHGINESMPSQRSNFHYWISDWYMRAFYTTGHAIPLLEAIFHLRESIRHLERFREDEALPTKGRPVALGWRRYKLWRVAVCDITKAFKLGRAALRLWLGPPQFVSWFPQNPSERQRLNDDLSNSLSGFVSALDCAKEIQAHGTGLINAACEELRQLTPAEGKNVRIKQWPGTMFQSMQPGPTVDLKFLSLDESCLGKAEKHFWRGSAPASIENLCRDVLASVGKASSEEIGIIIEKWQLQQLREDPSDGHLYLLAQQLNEWAFLIIRRTKLLQIIDIRKKGGLGLTPEIRAFWLLVTALCNSAHEICRLLHPDLSDLEQKERVKAKCLYGLALARLCRFHEAHRRFNEADALLSKMDTSGASVLLGILNLRRAETHLLEAIIIKRIRTVKKGIAADGFNDVGHLGERYDTTLSVDDEGALYKKETAKINDAWALLEDCERLISGQLHSSRWWSRLCCLKLRCLAEQSTCESAPSGPKDYRYLAQRSQGMLEDQICDLFQKGTASALGHTTLRLRLIDFALEAAMKCHPSKILSPGSRIAALLASDGEFLKECCDSIEKYVQQYAVEIHNKMSRNGLI